MSKITTEAARSYLTATAHAALRELGLPLTKQAAQGLIVLNSRLATASPANSTKNIIFACRSDGRPALCSDPTGGGLCAKGFQRCRARVRSLLMPSCGVL